MTAITTLKKTLLIATVLGASGAAAAWATDGAQGLVFKDKDEFGAAVKEYLFAHPEVLIEAVEIHRNNQRDMEKQAAEAKISEHLAAMTGKDEPSIGNADADIVIVEFFDYNCGYCKRALPAIQALVDADKNIRVVFKDLPILGPTSRTAALWALAAHKQGKYFDFHVALMNDSGSKEEAELANIAKSVGLDVEQMKKDAASPEIEAKLQQETAIASEIGVDGTPAFVIGSQFIPGYVDADTMKSIIAEERAKTKKDG